MNHETLKLWVAHLAKQHPDLELGQPATSDVLARAEETLGTLPVELASLYRITNGLENRSFKMFSVFDAARPKKTWDSLQRMNDPAKTQALQGDKELLGKFLVFADIGNGYAMINKSDGKIWFEESNDVDVRETDLGLQEFVEVMLTNAE